ncbi:hypothetical protein RHIZ404_230239 [Rhizobium sp. EC-SD404]|nr:hypothetical protein RHIZ404_230239 [Rhizobium sp. EC-SD404]
MPVLVRGPIRLQRCLRKVRFPEFVLGSRRSGFGPDAEHNAARVLQIDLPAMGVTKSVRAQKWLDELAL